MDNIHTEAMWFAQAEIGTMEGSCVCIFKTVFSCKNQMKSRETNTDMLVPKFALQLQLPDVQHLTCNKRYVIAGT